MHAALGGALRVGLAHATESLEMGTVFFDHFALDVGEPPLPSAALMEADWAGLSPREPLTPHCPTPTGAHSCHSQPPPCACGAVSSSCLGAAPIVFSGGGHAELATPCQLWAGLSTSLSFWFRLPAADTTSVSSPYHFDEYLLSSQAADGTHLHVFLAHDGTLATQAPLLHPPPHPPHPHPLLAHTYSPVPLPAPPPPPRTHPSQAHTQHAALAHAWHMIHNINTHSLSLAATADTTPRRSAPLRRASSRTRPSAAPRLPPRR